MTFKIKLNHRNAVPHEYAKTEYLAKRKAQKIARTAKNMAANVVSIVYVEDCLGGLRAQYDVSNPSRNLAGLS